MYFILNFGDIVMRKLVFIAFLAVLVVVVSGVVVGKEVKPVKPVKPGPGAGAVRPAPGAGRLRPARPVRPDKAGVSSRPNMNSSREKFVEDKIKQVASDLGSQAKAHKDFIAQLGEIKKIAAGEKAKKTVAKIQELIDKENKKFANEEKAAMKKFEAFKTRMREGLRRAPGTRRGFDQRPPKGKDGRGADGAAPARITRGQRDLEKNSNKDGGKKK